jgi:hypothetical protein
VGGLQALVDDGERVREFGRGHSCPYSSFARAGT